MNAKKLAGLSSEELELIDAEIYRRSLIESAKTTRNRGFRFNGKFFFYFFDAQHAARLFIVGEKNKALTP